MRSQAKGFFMDDGDYRVNRFDRGLEGVGVFFEVGTVADGDGGVAVGEVYFLAKDDEVRELSESAKGEEDAAGCEDRAVDLSGRRDEETDDHKDDGSDAGDDEEGVLSFHGS